MYELKVSIELKYCLKLHGLNECTMNIIQYIYNSKITLRSEMKLLCTYTVSSRMRT